jgi:hypothetical protein
MNTRVLLSLSVLTALAVLGAAPHAAPNPAPYAAPKPGPEPAAVKKNKPITTINVSGGLGISRSPSNGPIVGLFVQDGGISTNHVEDGSLVIDDFHPATRAALKGDPGPPGSGGDTDGPGATGVRTEFAGVGAPAPGGTFIGKPTASILAANNKGQTLFAASVDTDGNPLTVEYTGVFLAGPNQLTLIVKSGDTLPDGSVCGGISASQNHPNLLTDSGKAYLRLDVPTYITGVSGTMTALTGWDGVQLFKIIGKDTFDEAGRRLEGANNMYLLTPDRIAFRTAVHPAAGGAAVGETLMVYGAP